MDTPRPHLAKFLPYIFVVCGVIGLVASMILTLDKIELLKNPTFRPICDINPLFSCVSVASSPQSETFFGIPNSLFGVAGFSMILMGGLVLLAGCSLRRWFWRLLNLGLLAAIIFIHWLISQSIYVISALCLYCMAVWLVTAALFWYTTLYNIQQDSLPFLGHFKKVTSFMLRYHDIILVSWYTLIVFLIFQHFWSFFSLLL
ncbi:MAG TPA: vitamin K epoxide reductase family protein [Candidatus Acidoferrum sp.]|nr:vitamin K epoxide reductase family protein [Candidatus Acidoferrum sp.]